MTTSMNGFYGAVIIALTTLNGCGGGGSSSPAPLLPPPGTYTVGGDVTGLTGTVVLQLNGANDLSVNVAGPITFSPALGRGAAYAVTVKAQPSAPDQVCAVSNGSGTVANNNITNVVITCVTSTTALSDEHLYVASQLNNAVYVYNIAADGGLSGPSRVLAGVATLLDRPTSIGVDYLGRLYVANYGPLPSVGGNVTVYAAGATGNAAPIQTLLQDENPVYVSKGAEAFINVPAADFTKSTISLNPLILGSISLTTIPGIPLATTVPPFVVPDAISWDAIRFGSSDRGYLCAGTKNPLNSGGSIRCINQPVLVITGMPPPMSTPQILNGVGIDSFWFPAASPFDLKFMDTGHLVVSNLRIFGREPSVDTYAIPAGATGPLGVGFPGAQVSTVASITGSGTHLTSPTAIAFDSKGNVYVGDTGNASFAGSVHVFAPGATGNVPPIREITGLNYPFGIAIGK